MANSGKDVVLTAEAFQYLVDRIEDFKSKIKELQETIEIYKEEYKPIEINEFIDCKEIDSILEKKDKPQEDEELQNNDLSRIVG